MVPEIGLAKFGCVDHRTGSAAVDSWVESGIGSRGRPSMKAAVEQTGPENLQRIILSMQVVTALARLSSETRRESCAALFGVQQGAELSVNEIAPLYNSSRRPDHFAIAGRTLNRVLAATGRPMRGFYHSHSRKAWASPADIRAMEDVNIPWLIGAPDLANDKFFALRAYVRRAGRVYVVEHETRI